MMVGEVEASVLKSSHKVYVSDKSDLTTSGSMNEVPLKYVPMRNHNDILIFSREDTQEARLSSLYFDVPDILSNMLTKSQIHNENDDQVHKDVKVDGDGINNHDHTLEDV